MLVLDFEVLVICYLLFFFKNDLELLIVTMCIIGQRVSLLMYFCFKIAFELRQVYVSNEHVYIMIPILVTNT